MTDNEIIKALECCSSDDANCDTCPANKQCESDDYCLTGAILDLIKRQQAEIERLNDKVKRLQESVRLMLNYDDGDERIKSEAIKEFAERMKGVIPAIDDTYIESMVEDYIDNLVKEMTEEA